MDARNYARLTEISGKKVVVEIIGPVYTDGGDYIPIEKRYHPDFVKLLIDVTDVAPMPGEWWTYDGSAFAPPAPPSVAN
ncbi:hypothetical protein [Cupriavidus necator]|uniref:Uncharacterized protein n=1 Tax=Cupriavidus pinatubonensis (strain JMP 134 / LMG 1197) TaxID=264198 RepID=Q46YK8_CUPPJ|nr:hypothetical protein [Cupriavidus necator]